MDMEMELKWCKETAKKLENYELATFGKQKEGDGVIHVLISNVLRT